MIDVLVTLRGHIARRRFLLPTAVVLLGSSILLLIWEFAPAPASSAASTLVAPIAPLLSTITWQRASSFGEPSNNNLAPAVHPTDPLRALVAGPTPILYTTYGGVSRQSGAGLTGLNPGVPVWIPGGNGQSALQVSLPQVIPDEPGSGVRIGTFPLAVSTPTPIATATPTCSPGWTVYPNPAPADSALNGITALAADDLWAVGVYTATGTQHTLIVHGDGTNWTQVPSPDPPSGGAVLRGVAGVASNDVWAVGYAGAQTLTEHWNGSSWSIVPSSGTGVLNGVAGVATNDVWAVGQQNGSTLTEHWDGSGWTQMPSPGCCTTNGVAAVAANDVWAVGGYPGAPIMGIWHWNGSSWATACCTDVGLLESVTAVASNDVWAVGYLYTFCGGGTRILHWNGTVWSRYVYPDFNGALYGVSAVAANDIWAVGKSGNTASILHYGAPCATVSATVTPTTTRTATSVATTATPTQTPCTSDAVQNGGFETGQLSPWVIDGFNDPPAVSTAQAHSGTYSVFIGGYYGPEPNGDSSLYQQITVPPTGGTLSFWYWPGGNAGPVSFDYQDAYVTDLNGNVLATIMHTDDYIYSWVHRTFDMAAFAGQTVRIKFLVHEDGFGDVTFMYVDDVTLTTACATSTPPIATSTATRAPVASATCSPSGAWSIVPSPNPPAIYGSGLHAIAVISPNDIWAVGGYNDTSGTYTLTEHWNGSSWSIVPSPSNGALHGLAAVASNDVWAAGDYGVIEHWNGSAWSLVPNSIGGTLEAMTAVSSNDVWAVGVDTSGAGQTLTLHWDGSGWSRVSSPNQGTSRNILYGVAALSSNDVWAVGYYWYFATQEWALIEHWNGSNWSIVPNPNTGGRLQGVAAVSSNDVWAVGSLGGASGGLTMHWNGSAWTQVANPGAGILWAASAASSNDVWAVGYYGSGYSLPQTLHWDGSSWSQVAIPNPGGVYVVLEGVAAISSNNVWTVGWDETNSGSYSTLTEHYASSPCFTVTPTAVTTPTSTPPAAPTPCPIQFSDVPPGSTFYAYIRCLACRGFVSGYADGTYRPNNNITRGQIAKIVSNAANFNDDVTGRWTYHDVPASNTFWVWIERLTIHQVMSGYQCGGPNEPCDEQNRPYFRWANNATRAQLAKIDSNAAGYQEPPSGQTFTDVPPEHPFYQWIQRLAARGIMGGYNCGGPGEPCDPQNRPYFRPYNNVTRGQAAKIVANTFYPNCQTPAR